jgi:probable HAF family extracellular repeat protein
MKILNACKVGMALTAAAFLGLATSQPADAITFSLTDIGTLGGDYNQSYATDINEYGQVVGSSNTADGQGRAFLWEKSSGMVLSLIHISDKTRPY